MTVDPNYEDYMNAEQLKMILDLLRGLGVDGKDAFFWYLVADRGTSLVSILAVAAMVTYLIKTIAAAITRESRAEGALQIIADVVGANAYSPFSRAECEDVMNRVRALKAAQ